MSFSNLTNMALGGMIYMHSNGFAEWVKEQGLLNTAMEDGCSNY
jgi:hypothetical protein